jgi:hypothetical protein
VDTQLAAKLHQGRSWKLPAAILRTQEAPAGGYKRTLTPTEVDMVTVRSGAGNGDCGARTCPMAGNWSLQRRRRAVGGPDG